MAVWAVSGLGYCVSVVVSPANSQLAGVLVVLIAALLLQFVCNPFVSGDIDRVERGLLGSCVAIALLGAWSRCALALVELAALLQATRASR